MKEKKTESRAEAADGTDDYAVFPAVGEIAVGDKHHAERRRPRLGRVELRVQCVLGEFLLDNFVSDAFSIFSHNENNYSIKSTICQQHECLTKFCACIWRCFVRVIGIVSFGVLAAFRSAFWCMAMTN